jgi:energy-coupling factor transporter ATP-binding protein EcfA2
MTIVADVATNIVAPRVLSAKYGHDCELGSDTLSDLEVFEAYGDDASKGDVNDTIFEAVDFTLTSGGSTVLQAVLERPIHDVATLRERRKALERVSTIYTSNREEVDGLLRIVEEKTRTVEWFMRQRTEEERVLFEMVYFSSRLLRRLNNNAACLEALNIYRMYACPLIGILSPILYFVIPFLIIRFKYDVKIGFQHWLQIMHTVCNQGIGAVTGSSKVSYGAYLITLTIYGQGVMAALEVSAALRKVVALATDKLQDVTLFVDAAERLAELFPNDAIANGVLGFDDEKPNADASPDVRESFGTIKALAPSNLARGSVGGLLVKFKLFDWRDIAPTAMRAFVIDAAVAVVKAKDALRLCYADVLDDALPVVRAEALYHVCLPQPAVRNDVSLGGERCNNAVITGPNAGGKSTLVKALFAGLLMAQTLGIAAAEKFSYTPFHVIDTQMNVPDCKGHASLFEAEMNRCKAKLETVERAAAGGVPSKRRRVAMAFDEIFSSTEPTEGVAGAFAIARALSRHPNVVNVITTHFTKLCDLAEEEDFEALRMMADISPSGKITFSYRVEPGVSKQHVALELLRAKGFDATIIEDALDVRRQILEGRDQAEEKEDEEDQME